MRFLIALWALSLLWADVPQTPGSLTVVAATGQQVQLKWDPVPGVKGYTVSRKAEDGDSYSTVQVVTTPSVTDKAIDPFGTYTYRVAAVNDDGTSSASPPVIVGPPPYGYNLLSSGPNYDSATFVGVGLRMAADSNGDPAFAWIVRDPNADGDDSDSTLWFLSWSRVQYKWNDVVPVGKVGNDGFAGSTIPISLARDKSNNAWAIAITRVVGDNSFLDFALSTDGGQTWKTQNVRTLASPVLARPSLAMGAGKVFLAFTDHGTGPVYVTGNQSDAPSKWTTKQIAVPSGYDWLAMHSLALDSAGNPGIAFIGGNNENSAEYFARPETGTVTLIATNGGYNDNGDIVLSFYGTEPRIAMIGARTEDANSAWDKSAWVMRSTGDGSSWLPGVSLPSDGQQSMVGPIGADSGSRGQFTVVVSNNGGIYGTATRNFPHYSQSDDLITFRTTGPAPAGNPEYGKGHYPSVLYYGNDRLWLSFVNRDQADGGLPPGIYLWRER